MVGCKDRGWPWKSVCRGLDPLCMDMWSVERNDPDRKLVRRSLGRARSYTERMDLAASRPRGDLASSGFCLAEPGRCYLVYAPNGGERRELAAPFAGDAVLFVERVEADSNASGRNNKNLHREF